MSLLRYINILIRLHGEFTQVFWFNLFDGDILLFDLYITDREYYVFSLRHVKIAKHFMVA